jgi:hypothetical protein
VTAKSIAMFPQLLVLTGGNLRINVGKCRIPFWKNKSPSFGYSVVKRNGPCYVSRDTVAFAKELGFEVCTTLAYSPESNRMAEAFVKTFKRDYIAFYDPLNAIH